jgi:hypothetical protein
MAFSTARMRHSVRARVCPAAPQPWRTPPRKLSTPWPPISRAYGSGAPKISAASGRMAAVARWATGTRVTEVWDVEKLPPALQNFTQAQLDERSRYTETMPATTGMQAVSGAADPHRATVSSEGGGLPRSGTQFFRSQWQSVGITRPDMARGHAGANLRGTRQYVKACAGDSRPLLRRRLKVQFRSASRAVPQL